MSEGTGNMMLRMLGLDGLAAALTSQDFQAQAQQVIAAILETRIRCERIEFKLDALLDALEAGGMPHVRRRAIPIASAPPNGSSPGGWAGAGATSDAADLRDSAAAAADRSGIDGAQGNGGLPGHTASGLGVPQQLVAGAPHDGVLVRLGAMAPSLPPSLSGKWLE